MTADFAHQSMDLSRYRLVVVPQSYVLRAEEAANLRRYVEGGGTLVVSYFSGIVDENDAVHLGGYPGALRDVLGVRVDEFLPLAAGQSVAVTVRWTPATAKPRWRGAGPCGASRSSCAAPRRC